MKALIAAAIFCCAASAAFAETAPAPEAPVAIPVHKKAPPTLKHKKVSVKKERIKKLGN